MISLNSFSKAHSIGSYHLGNTNAILDKSINRLSSGLRINSSVDAPGELGVASRLNSKVVHSSVLKRNLSNVSTFLETQQAHLLQLAEIYRERMAIDIKNQSPLATADEIAIYNNQDQMLYDRILQLRDAKFGGVRLFSPDHNLLTMDADTALINGASETISQFNLFTQNDPRPLEMIFLADISGSMGPYINNVISNISGFINSVSSKLNTSSWTAKAVGYRLDGGPIRHTFRAPNGGAFVSSIPDLTSQLTSLRGQVTGGVAGLGESLIDGVYDAINVAGGWQNTDSRKVLIGFTDEPSEAPRQPGVTINGVAAQLASNDVNFYLFTNDPADSETQQLTSQSGATVGSLASANADMNTALSGIVDSLITTDLVDYDTIARYIAENSTKQNIISNLISSSETYGSNVKAALGQIQDLDVAKESIIKARYEILQGAGTAILAQANQSVNATLTLLT